MVSIIEKNIKFNYNAFKEEVENYLKEKGIKIDSLSRVEKISAIKKMYNACKRCKLQDKKINPVISSKYSDYTFIVRYGMNEEVKLEQPLIKGYKKGDLFNQYLNILDLEKGDINIFSLLYCCSSMSKSVCWKYLNKCKKWKYVEFDWFGVSKYIFLTGNFGLRIMIGNYMEDIRDVLGNIYKSKLLGEEVYLIPLLHPGYIFKENKTIYKEKNKEVLEFVKNKLEGG